MEKSKSVYLRFLVHPLVLLLLLFCLFSTALFAGPSAYGKNEQGNKLYKKGKYQEALKKYTEAQLTLPESLELHYNIGNVLYKQGRFDEASSEYDKSVFSDRKDLTALSYFNRGNARFMQQDYQGAVDSYIESLKIDPHDKDAKKNLELALQRLQQSQKESQQPQSDSSEKPEQKEEPSEEQNREKSSEEESTQKESPGKPSEGEEEREENEQEKEWQKMLLDAIEEQEKEALKKSLKKGSKEEKEVEKDW